MCSIVVEWNRIEVRVGKMPLVCLPLLESGLLGKQVTPEGKRSPPHLLQKTLQSPACRGPTPGVAGAPVPDGSPLGAQDWGLQEEAVCLPSPGHFFRLHLGPQPKPSGAFGVLAPSLAQPIVPLSLSWPWDPAWLHLGHFIFKRLSCSWGSKSQVTPLSTSHPACGLLGVQPMDNVNPPGLPPSIRELTSCSPRGRQPSAV